MSEQAVAAEVSVLGALLLAPEVADTVLPLLAPESFSRPAHARIFEAMYAVRVAERTIDLVSVMEELRRQGKLEGIGGAAYLAHLADAVPAAANVLTYVDIVREAAARRELVKWGRLIVEIGTDGRQPVAEMLADAQMRIAEIGEGIATDKGTFNMEALIHMTETPEETITFGMDWLDSDEAIGAVPLGSLFVIGGWESSGKTSLLLQMLTAAAKLGHAASLISVEMPARQLAIQLLSQESRVPHRMIRNGNMQGNDIERLAEAKARLAGLPLRICDLPGATPERALAAGAAEFKRSRVVGLDYIQLLRGGGDDRKRRLEVDAISVGFKGLARQHQGVAVLISQLRKVEGGSQRRPVTADLKESGGLQADPDQIVLLYHPEDDYENRDAVKRVEVIIGKNRFGARGQILSHIGFHGACVTFAPLENRGSYIQEAAHERPRLARSSQIADKAGAGAQGEGAGDRGDGETKRPDSEQSEFDSSIPF